jgi:hypothetical protein
MCKFLDITNLTEDAEASAAAGKPILRDEHGRRWSRSGAWLINEDIAIEPAATPAGDEPRHHNFASLDDWLKTIVNPWRRGLLPQADAGAT